MHASETTEQGLPWARRREERRVWEQVAERALQQEEEKRLAAGNLWEAMRFRGVWRPAQARVLRRAEEDLRDGRLHVVAAPGSGKTTLGLEIVRRLGVPCLTLAPTRTIRDQWLQRLRADFLPAGVGEEWLSCDLRAPRAFTAATYQALDAALSPEAELDIVRVLRQAGVRTLCLDEAHHLRAAWWQALEELRKEMPELVVVALTATPPYDSTPAQWRRYIELCGPIDEEIFTPELVREGSLCPHEDYVYFSFPGRESRRAAEAWAAGAHRLCEELRQSPAFLARARAHKALRAPELWADRLLEEPRAFFALLVFLNDRGEPLPRFFRAFVGRRAGRPDLPACTDAWLEALAQDMLDRPEHYDAPPPEELRRRLKAAGCLERGRVALTRSEAVEKRLAADGGKLESIARIYEAERASLKADLRLLVLCDYIRAEALGQVGSEGELRELGAVPIFELLRRRGAERLGLLSGSVVLLPLEAEGALRLLLPGARLAPIRDTGYGRLQGAANAVAAVTELFARGEVRALVGTKALLGEGWDAPGVNALVLATVVGSFLLSNQMRGRTIRSDANDPKKTGNVWHLACLCPRGGAELSPDMETLERRFRAFLGVSVQRKTIESGLARLGLGPLVTRGDIERENARQIQRAMDREGLRRRWQEALQVIRGEMEVEQVQELPRQAALGFLFRNALAGEVLSLVAGVGMAVGQQLLLRARHPLSLLLGAGAVGFALLAARFGVRLFRFTTPERRLRALAEALRQALGEAGALSAPENCRCEVRGCAAWLEGGSTRDKALFARCLSELFGPIENPRYLLLRGRGGEAYAVPQALGGEKRCAEIFARCVRQRVGRLRLVYTRAPEGRRLLLRARVRAYVARNARELSGRLVVRGRWD